MVELCDGGPTPAVVEEPYDCDPSPEVVEEQYGDGPSPGKKRSCTTTAANMCSASIRLE